MIINLTPGIEQRVWCNTCMASHAKFNVYGYFDDSIDHFLAGQYVDCPIENPESEN